MRLKLTAAALALAFTSTAALAATCGNTAQGFKGFLAAVKKDASAQGISGEVLANLDGLQYDTSIIKSLRQGSTRADHSIYLASSLPEWARVIYSFIKRNCLFDGLGSLNKGIR